MKRIILFSAVASVIIPIVMISCQEFIEKNLKKETLTVNSPPDNFVSTSNSVTFWWEETKGADHYNIQIVIPSFTNIQKLVLDSNVTGDKYTQTLQPGIYQWRIRAENTTSETNYITRTLTVDTTSDLTQQSIVLISPADSLLSNKTAQTFKWDTVYGAEEYRIQIAKPGFSGSYTLVVDAAVQIDSFSYTLSEGTFQWRVRAQNSSSNSSYTTRTLTIDATAPIVSVPSLPLNGDTATSPVTIKWIRNTGTIADSLFVYTDTLLVPVVSEYHSDTLKSYSTSQTGDHFWKLRSVDAAGNWSGYSGYRKFVVK